MTTPLLEARKVTKRYPGVVALNGVSMQIQAGTIHALLGENGAGKSTLIKAFTGVHLPDEGEIIVQGAPVVLSGIRAASERGIGVVHQERHLISVFSVGENIMLDRLGPRVTSLVDYNAVNDEARKWLREMDLDIEPTTPVAELSVAQTQLVEIAKALSLQSQVLFMDEPTSSLTEHEADGLFALLRKLRDAGRAIVFVSHKLEEVLALCDTVTVLRDGQNACQSTSLEGVSRADLVQLMIGRSERIPNWEQRNHKDKPIVLQLDNFDTSLGHNEINFSLHKGEVLGLYGLIGAGRTELAKAIIGEGKVTSGRLRIDGQEVKISSVSQALHKYGIGYVSEDRKGEGLILMHSVLDNAGITIWRRLQRALGFLKDRKIRNHTMPVIKKLEVRTPSLNQTMGNLSGGNQQKVSVAKWLAANVNILIIDEPTIGVDIKTKSYIHELIRTVSDEGTSVLLITSDMPEMITVADRILVMDKFELRGEIDNNRDYAIMSQEIMGHIHASTEGEQA